MQFHFEIGSKEWVNLPCVPFDLHRTLQSGQVFHWDISPEICCGVVDREVLCLRWFKGNWQVPRRSFDLAISYFSLDHPLEEVWETFPADPLSQAALRACKGLRIIRQPRWECLATFITSPLKQIAHIRQMSQRLRKKYGEAGTAAYPGTGLIENPLVPDHGSQGQSETIFGLERYPETELIENPLVPDHGSRGQFETIFGFGRYPDAEVLASLREEDLRACGLGFRARALLGTARAIVDGDVDLEAIGAMETPRACEVLMRLPGVGEKVAHCVLLFAYERLDVVPVDVWIGRVLHQMGLNNGKISKGKAGPRFGPYGGYVQQYLFHYARTNQVFSLSK